MRETWGCSPTRIIILALIASLGWGAAQGYTFADLLWGSTRSEVTHALTNAGYIYSGASSDGLTNYYDGKVLSKEAWVFASFTPNDALVKVSIYIRHNEIPRARRFFEAEKTLNTMIATLTSKYGPPSSTFDFFMSPYYRGDGFETQAVEVGKARFAGFWEQISGQGLWIEIDADVDVAVHYESAQWSNELQRRRNSDLDHF